MNFYSYQKIVGKIDDVSELRDEFITIFDTKTKSEIVTFCLRLANYLLETTSFQPTAEMISAFEELKKWLNGETNYHSARNLSFQISRLAKDKTDPAQVKFYRTMAQIAASPHTKFHGLWATDIAITMVNKLFPNDMEKVRTEREKYIELLLSCGSH
ncbi:putative immunity protein [Streptococcus entericus]|uniref:putative immunity protein n=1 Tax=Streptococcus entericus TaxID=155680 RepID=UPI00037DA2AA|nr:hypothetical protein [Streptococcus entericus]